MLRSIALATALVTVFLLALGGCGGGGGGGAVMPPSTAQTQQVFVVDFVHNTVTTAVKPQLVDRKPGETTAALALTLALRLTETGNPGRRQLSAEVKNNSSGTVGLNDRGISTGIDLCFVKTVFTDSSTPAKVISGGAYASYDSLNPADGTPIYHLAMAVPTGGTTHPWPRLVDLVLPAGATTAVLTVIVRADTQRFIPPDLTRWYLTTLAGRSGVPGSRDGATSRALFSAASSSLYRDDLGDLLVAEESNNRVRRVDQGQVTTFAGTGAPDVCTNPVGLGRDSAGNVYISERLGHCVSVVPPDGGAPTVIAGARGVSGDNSNCSGSAARFSLPSGLAVSDNLVYVADSGNHKVKLLTYNGSGNRLDPASWYVTDLTNGAPFAGPRGVTVDARGNVYLADYDGRKVYVLPMGSSAWTAIAGSGTNLETDQWGLNADLYQPQGIAVDQSGYLYVADRDASLRRLCHTSGSLTSPATWTVQTLVPKAAASVDGFAGTGKVFALRGVSCARDGALYLTESCDVRRLDRTRN